MGGRKISRRELLGSAAAGSAAAALAPATRSAAAVGTTRFECDVIVIGAGFAGLAAARVLRKKGVHVRVVEARDRVGGRILNHPIGRGEIIEVGGQWVGPTQDRVLALIDELKLKTFPTFNDGDYVDHRNGNRVVYPKDVPIPPGDPAAAAEAAGAIVRLDEMANQVPLEAPWEAPEAIPWDSQTVETWIRDNVQSPGGQELLRLGIQAIFACEPRDISLLHALFYIHSGESIERLIAIAGGAQESRVVGGTQKIALEMAKQLGDRVLLGHRVERIRHSKRGVAISGPKLRASASRIIVALAPTLAGRIEYDPPLPALRDQFTQRAFMGSVIKVQAIYDEPFWRADGLTGFATSDVEPVKLSFDNSPPGGSPGVLMGFMEGSPARRFAQASTEERRKATLDCFALYFGDKAKDATGYVDRNWAKEEYSRGCYAGLLTSGTWIDYGKWLRKPVGRIHWAGTETATVWNGYMDGAVRSGEDAAEEVAKRL